MSYQEKKFKPEIIGIIFIFIIFIFSIIMFIGYMNLNDYKSIILWIILIFALYWGWIIWSMIELIKMLKE